MRRNSHRVLQQGRQFDEWLKEFLPAALRLVAKIRAYVPLDGAHFHQANLPAFPRQRAEREIKTELFTLKGLLADWQEDVDEKAWGCPEDAATGVVWFGNLVSHLIDRWGWGCKDRLTNGQISETSGGGREAVGVDPRITVCPDELEAMGRALSLVLPNGEGGKSGSPLFPSFRETGEPAEPPTGKHNGVHAIPRSKITEKDLMPCPRDCLETVRQAGKRLTNAQITKRLNDAGKTHGDCTIRTALAFLRREGFLDNRSDTKPRGYGAIQN